MSVGIAAYLLAGILTEWFFLHRLPNPEPWPMRALIYTLWPLVWLGAGIVVVWDKLEGPSDD